MNAAVVGYWRFESGAFLADSSGNGFNLTNGSGGSAAAQVSLPASGGGSAFPTTIPGTGASNGSAASFDGGDILSTPDNPAFTSTTFTVEAFVTTGSLGATQAIAGQLSGASGNANRSFLLAINGSGALQMNYNSSSTAASGLPALEAGKDYYVAVTVDMADLTTSGITFYVKNLTDNTAMVSNGVTHTGTTLVDSAAAFAIGSTASPSSPWTGLIDEVRLSNTKLSGTELLMPIPEPSAAALAGLAGFLALGRRRR